MTSWKSGLTDEQIDDVEVGFAFYPDATHVAINPHNRDDWDFYNYDDDPDFFETYENTKPYIVISRKCVENDDSIWK